MNDRTNMQLLRTILRHQSLIFSSALLYSPEHPRVQSGIPEMLDPLQRFLSSVPDLTLIIKDSVVLYLGKPLVQDPNITRLAKLFSRLGIGYITFTDGVDASDIRQMIRCISGAEPLERLKNQFSKIRVGEVDVHESGDKESDVLIDSFKQISKEQLEELQKTFNGIACQEQIETRVIMSLVAGFIASFRREANPLLALVPIRDLDEYTFTHSIDVGILNIAQGMSLGIEGQLLHDLGVAGMLHDAGKVFIDKAILQKPGSLSDEEMSIMKSHPSSGAQYLMNQKGVPLIAVISSFEHHMRYDLQGYPPVHSGWQLNLASQMTMISDTFDALRTRRVYKGAWDFPKVCGHMLTLAGTQLNPELVINFLKLLAELGETIPGSDPDDTVPSKDNYCE